MVTYSDDASILLSSTLTPTKGLHTTSTTRLALHRGDRRRSPCTLHLYFTLPTQLFADPYELAHRGESYRFERFGGGNLEAPVFAPGAGADAPSGLLLDLIVPEGGEAVDDVGIGGDGDGDGEDGRVVQIDVPLHARYGVPKMGGGERINEVTLPIPEAFWACPTTNSRNIEGAPPVIHTRSFFIFYFYFGSAVWPNESNSHQLLSYVCNSRAAHANTRCPTSSGRVRTCARWWRREDARLDSACRVGSRADASGACWRCGRCGGGGGRYDRGCAACVCVSLSDDSCPCPIWSWSCICKRSEKRRIT